MTFKKRKTLEEIKSFCKKQRDFSTAEVLLEQVRSIELNAIEISRLTGIDRTTCWRFLNLNDISIKNLIILEKFGLVGIWQE